MTHCQECARPWGVILERGEQPSPEQLALCRAELHEQWTESAECDVDEGAVFDYSKLPDVYVTEVVYLTDAVINFAIEHCRCDTPYDEACWVEVRHAELPGWLLTERKRRWAYRWDCCDIGFADNYVLKPAEVAS